MKFLIASDVHGSAYFAEKIIEIFKKENAQKLILLGDIYNHGPRNCLSKQYDPMRVAELFNGIKENLIVIKGNCDSVVDTMISEFDFVEHAVINSGSKLILLTHGHVYNKDSKPKTKYDAIIYGHFHTGFIEEKDGVIFANAGSISLPKGGTPESYIILEDGKITLKDLSSNVIAEKE